ncbi:MAG: hypothetical protein PUB94_05930 [Oscillospiraceae bacterium]|nr:hypothetical protein [Oscillospiraceae bacterium]
MVNIKFLRGLEANLPTTATDGIFYLTTDTHRLFVGQGTALAPVNQGVIEVANVDALASKTAHAGEFYYAKAENILCVYNGTKYIQINSDTGATSVETVGEGNSITGVSYDPATRKITFTMGATYTTASDVDKAITDKIGTDIKVDGENATVKEYVDKKVSDAVAGSISGLGALASKDKVSSSELDDNLSDKIDEIDNKVKSINAADNSVAVGGTTTEPTIGVKISPAAGNALSIDDTEGQEGLKAIIPTAAEYTVVKDGTPEDGYAATYHLTKDGVNTGAAINIPKDMVVQSGSVVTNPEGHDAGTYLKLVLANADNTEIFIPVDTLIEYVTSGSQTDDAVVIAIDDTTHKVTATLSDGKISLAKLDADTQTKINKAHSHDNKEVLDNITSEKVAAWDAAQANVIENVTSESLSVGAITDKSIAIDLAWVEF